MNNFLKNKQTNKGIILIRRIVHNDIYQEDVDSSANKIRRSSSGSRGDTHSIGSNASGEWSCQPLINMSYSSFYPIINNVLG